MDSVDGAGVSAMDCNFSRPCTHLRRPAGGPSCIGTMQPLVAKEARMYFKVRINGTEFGVFGHPNVLNMHLSVQWVRLDGSEGAELFASAVCVENGTKYFYDWVQHPLSPADVVEIRPTDDTRVPEPRIKYEMKSRMHDE